jgi:hypothetical protein
MCDFSITPGQSKAIASSYRKLKATLFCPRDTRIARNNTKELCFEPPDKAGKLLVRLFRLLHVFAGSCFSLMQSPCGLLYSAWVVALILFFAAMIFYRAMPGCKFVLRIGLRQKCSS